jgi:hypothetical protein
MKYINRDRYPYLWMMNNKSPEIPNLDKLVNKFKKMSLLEFFISLNTKQ